MLLLDEAWSKVDPAGARAAGYGGIIGYVSQDSTGKDLTRANIDQAHAAGLDVGLVYEFNPKSALGGIMQGLADAHTAITHANALGAPLNMCIYAAVDFDAQESDMAAVAGYATTFHVACRNNGFRSGMYGGLRVCTELPLKGYGGILWQTYAWSGGNWAPGVAVRQVQNGIHVAGANVDRDLSMVTDWGQWPAANAPRPVSGGDFIMTHWTTVAQGATGQPVKNVQGLLIAHGYPVGSKTGLPDGSFGPVTAQSTRAIQAAHGLTVDGIFGPHTASVALFGVDVA